MAKEKKEKEEKQSLSALMVEMNKKYGNNAIVSKTEYVNPENIISTGSIAIDDALGVGGLVRGKIVEIMGWQSCGKSTLTLNIIAEAQKKGLKCALIDGEFSFDRKYAEAIGLNVDDLIISQPGHGEAAYDIANGLMKTDEIAVVIIDSQTSLLPLKAMSGEGGEYSLGLHARLLSLEIPKLLQNAANHNVLVCVISQYREKIGIMFGNPTTTNGGHALPFYSHVRLEVSRKEIDKESETNIIKVKVVKNKLAVPFKEAEVEIIWGVGFNKNKEYLDKAIDFEIITKTGNTYSYGDIKLGVGMGQLEQFLKDNPELLLEIKEKVLTKLKGEE